MKIYLFFFKIRPAVEAATVAVFKLRAGCPTQEAGCPKKLEMLPLGWKNCPWVGNPALSLKTATVAAATAGRI